MKILCLGQNVTDMVTLDKGLSLAHDWCASINLDLQIVFKGTNRKFTSIPFSNDVNNNGYTVNPIEVFQEAKQTGIPFDVALLVYDATKIFPNPTNPFDSGMSMSIPIQWYTTYPSVLAEFLLHELCHYFFQGNGQLDRTHEYNSAFSQKPRKDWYLFLLKGMAGNSVTLKRNSDDGIQTLGELTYKGQSFKTLERPWKYNAKNISCIPKGEYDCKWTFSLRLMRYTYEVMNVPARSGIRLHRGNYFYDVDGCVLLGDGFKDINKDGKLDVVNSVITLQKFEQMMNYQPFKLKII